MRSSPHASSGPARRTAGWSPATLGVLALLLLVPARVRAEPTEATQSEALQELRLQGIDGRWVDYKTDFMGRITVLSFWRLDQEHSLRSLRDLERLRAEYAAQGVAVVGIVAGEADRTRVAQVVEELGLGFPTLFDPERVVYAELGVIVTPSSWFFDAQGTARFSYRGHRDDFPAVARAHLDFLSGRIGEAEHARIVEPREELDFAEPLESETHYRFAQQLLRKGRRETAEAELTTAWESDPPLVKAGVDLGLLLLEQGRDAEALTVLERAAKLAPDDGLALGALGVAQIRVGRTEAGEKSLRRGLELGADWPLLHYEMGRRAEQSGDRELAIRHYRRGLELSLEGAASPAE